MITLSNYVLDIADKLCLESGETYSEIITRLFITETLKNRKD